MLNKKTKDLRKDSSGRPRVLVLSSRAIDDTGPIGGVTGYLRSLSSAAPHDWRFFTPLPSQGADPQRSQQPHLGPALKRSRVPRRLKFPLRVLRYLSQIRTLDPQIIYSHENEATTILALARSLGYLRAALVHHQHGSVNPLLRATYGIGRFWPFVWTYQTILRWTHRQCDLIIAIDQECVRMNVEWGKGTQTILLPNAVNTNFFSPEESPENLRAHWDIPSQAKVLFSAGRLEQVKRYDLVIKAFQECAMEDAYLLIAGEGTQRKTLETLAATRKEGIKIRFLGNQEASVIRDLMRLSDVFVLLSEFEGVPMVLLEALSTGLPVLATRVGGIPDLIPDKEKGILLDSQVTIREVANAMSWALRKKWNRQNIRAWGETFSASGAISKLTMAFDQLE